MGEHQVFLMQMAGWMGSGKSTLATAIARQTGAVVLDHDTTKTALLEAGVPHPPAGAASYEVLFGVGRDLLAHGHAVIIDSPSVYAEVPERGLTVAAAAGVPYFFVECECDEGLAEARLLARERRGSQVASAAEAAAVRSDPLRRPHRPSAGALCLDTRAPLDECLTRVLEYLEGPGAAGPVTT